jgi:hypothetical protein
MSKKLKRKPKKIYRPEPVGMIYTLVRIIQQGQPIPLAWIVKHSESFESEWASGWSEPAIMMDILSRVVSHKQLSLAAISLAREALIYIPNNEPRPLLAIKAAERWVAGEGSAEAADRAAIDAIAAGDVYAEIIGFAAAADASYAAGHAASTTFEEEAPYEASLAGYYFESLRASHKPPFVAVKLAISDLVRAGRLGWKQ